MQGLLRFGHGQLPDSCFMLIGISDAKAAGRWLQNAPVTTATATRTPPTSAVQVAITPGGLKMLGLPQEVLNDFPDEYIVGMSGDEGRSRRLGDIDTNAPENWFWGHHDARKIHLLLMLYAREGEIKELKNETLTTDFNNAFRVIRVLPTDPLGTREPFGFVDGISQPVIDWRQTQPSDVHSRDTYSNLLAPGEIVLGYPNEYGQFTPGPRIESTIANAADSLPTARSDHDYRDLGKNGTYIVIRQLEQDVEGFWAYMNTQSDSDRHTAEHLASMMVGRDKDGAPLVPLSNQPIPGIPETHTRNHFNYDDDPHGKRCPISSHVRRSNPRTGDFPPGTTGFWIRLIRFLGFGRTHEYEDTIASSRFHRILRRGRTYGMTEPETNTDNDDNPGKTGLHFICLAANIVRQFEFVQSAWSTSSAFAGLHRQRDPITAHRQMRLNSSATDTFNYTDNEDGPVTVVDLPQFVTVRGGAYLFMPGIRALNYLAQIAQHNSGIDEQSENST